MAEISGFHNSRNGDRRVKADFFARFFGSLIGNGVFPNQSTGCQVIANNDMTVTFKTGKAWINGVFYENTDDMALSLDVADGVLKRIDRVVLQFSTIDRTIEAKVKKGTFASSPVAPSLQRDADAYELGIADIFVGNGVVSVSQASITDLRLNSNYCGVVAALINQVDTTTLFNQYQAWYLETTNQAAADLSTMLSAFQSSFNAWFADLQDILDENTAGNLLNMINDLTDRINAAETSISNLKKFQTAGGNGTAITLSNIEFVDGFQTTFVILAGNSGAVTTINTKPLYKPGTTTSPKLIAGKAATVWYNSTGDCFFIKASAEGDAEAGDVLAGKKFSNDDDIGLIGTLALTGDAVAGDVYLGKTFYKNDLKTKLTGTNPYKSGKMIWYDEFEKPQNLLISELATGTNAYYWMFYNKFTGHLINIAYSSPNYYIRKYDADNIDLTKIINSITLSGLSYMISCVNYGDFFYIFDINGWKKYSSIGTLISSGSDFKIDSVNNTAYQIILELESESLLMGVQPDKSVKWFDLEAGIVTKTLTFSDLATGYPFRDKYGNWYYEITGGYYKKVDIDGNIIFSQSIDIRLAENNGTYPVNVLDNLDMFFQTHIRNSPDYFYAKAFSMTDGSMIYSSASYDASIIYSAQQAKVSKNGKNVFLIQLLTGGRICYMEIDESGVVDYGTFTEVSTNYNNNFLPSLPRLTFANDKLFFNAYTIGGSYNCIGMIQLGWYLA